MINVTHVFADKLSPITTRVQGIVPNSDYEDQNCKSKTAGNYGKMLKQVGKTPKLPEEQEPLTHPAIGGQNVKASKRHQKIHSREMKRQKNSAKHRCNMCKKILGSASSLRRHVKTVHETKDFKCPSCNSCFKCSNQLKKHTTTVHKEMTKSQCGCGKQFRSNSTFKRHAKRCQIITHTVPMNKPEMAENLDSTIRQSEQDILNPRSQNWNELDCTQSISTKYDKVVHINIDQEQDNVKNPTPHYSGSNVGKTDVTDVTLQEYCEKVQDSKPRINMMRARQQPHDVQNSPPRFMAVEQNGGIFNGTSEPTDTNQPSTRQPERLATQNIDLPPLMKMPDPEAIRGICEENPTNMGIMSHQLDKYTYLYDHRQTLYLTLQMLAYMPNVQSHIYQQSIQQFNNKQRDLALTHDELLGLYNKRNIDEDDEFLELPRFGHESKIAMRDVEALPKFDPDTDKITLYDFWHKMSTHITAERLTEDAAKMVMGHCLLRRAYNVYMINRDCTLHYIMKKLRDQWPTSFPTRAKFEEDIATFERADNEKIQASMNRFEYMIKCLYKNESNVNSIIENKCKLKVLEIAHPAAKESLERKRKQVQDQGIDLTYLDILEILTREEEIINKRTHEPRAEIHTMIMKDNGIRRRKQNHEERSSRHKTHEPTNYRHERHRTTNEVDKRLHTRQRSDPKYRYRNHHPDQSDNYENGYRQEYQHVNNSDSPPYEISDHNQRENFENFETPTTSHATQSESKRKDYSASRAIHPRKLAMEAYREQIDQDE